MAATYWRLTGKPGVALATLGPGATNMMTWVAYAQLWWMPIIVITWQKPIRTSKQWAFQVIDIVSMMKPITKFSISIVDGARISSNIAHAFEVATEERPWAVHIELPEDIARQEVSKLYSQPIIGEKIRRPQIDEKQLKQLIIELEKAKYPLILVGAWANRKRISNYLTKFVTKYNIPVFASQMWKWVIDERLSQYIWTAALTSNDYLHPAIEQADLILAVWHDVIEKPTNIIEQWKTKVIHINFTTAKIDMFYTPSMQVIGDIWNTFWQLFDSKIDISNWNLEKIYKFAKEGKTKKLKLVGNFNYSYIGTQKKLFSCPHTSCQIRDRNW